jgi:DNA-binding transcriptional LysR family regulator
MDLDLRKLRYFVAVAEELHFRRAAERLYIAQPALSRQIARLERELGVALLTRDRRGVELTAAGRQLLQDARALLSSADATRRRAQRAGRGTRRLAVGFRAGIVPTQTIRAFAEAHPDVAVEVRRMEWDDQEELILGGAVDIGYVRAPVTEGGLRLIALYDEPRLVALPIDHPLATQFDLVESQLAAEPHLRYTEPSPLTGARLRSVEEKLEHVAAGHGIILLPRSATRYYTRPDIAYVPVLDAALDRVWLATEASTRSKIISAFIEAAHRTIPDGGFPIIEVQASAL